MNKNLEKTKGRSRKRVKARRWRPSCNILIVELDLESKIEDASDSKMSRDDHLTQKSEPHIAYPKYISPIFQNYPKFYRKSKNIKTIHGDSLSPNVIPRNKVCIHG